jgi:hypothetical protein
MAYLAHLVRRLIFTAVLLWASDHVHAQVRDVADVADFELTVQPRWNPPLPGDPLPVTVRLSCPRAQALALFWLDDQEGTANAPPDFAPFIHANWIEGLHLELVRVESSGQRSIILAANEWPIYRETNSPVVESSPSNVFIRSHRFWLPPSVAQLTQGTYDIEARWIGTNFTDSKLLPPGGVLSAKIVRLDVQPLQDDAEAAMHAERLARQAYRDGDRASARDEALESLRRGRLTPSPDRVETYLLAAISTLELGDLKSSVKILQDLANELPTSDATGLRAELLQSIAFVQPRLQLEAAFEVPRLRISGTTGQDYVVMVSTNLQIWTVLSTNLSVNSTFWVDDPDWSRWQNRFYRSFWLPD